MYQCQNCNAQFAKWSGKCLKCGEWNTLSEKEDLSPKLGKKSKSGSASALVTITSLTTPIDRSRGDTERIPLESEELSRVLGGGLTRGSLTLLSGEPGIGKSTLSLQIADWHAREGRSTLYISAEENFDHLSKRAERLHIHNEHILFAQTSRLESSLELIANHESDCIIIDSISLMSTDQDVGIMSALKIASEAYMNIAKHTKKSIFLIGHVTKDGSISGPKVLEHLVDTVLFLEGEKWENYRILRALKNRFGPTDEIALFRMEEDGLHDIKNAGMEFVNTTHRDPGSVICMTIEGTRPLLIEVEALVTYTKFGYPKRSSRGVSSTKLDLLIATLIKHTDLSLDSSDVYTNIARGLNLSDPGIDLAIVAAIISSKKNINLENTIFIGEVSLTGRLKAPHLVKKRIEEAKKLGFQHIVCAQGSSDEITTDKSIILCSQINEIATFIEKEGKKSGQINQKGDSEKKGSNLL